MFFRNIYFEINSICYYCITQKINIMFLQTYLLISCVIVTLWLSFTSVCDQVRYVRFNTNLNLFSLKRKSATNFSRNWPYIINIILWMVLLSECNDLQTIHLATYIKFNPWGTLGAVLKFK